MQYISHPITRLIAGISDGILHRSIAVPYPTCCWSGAGGGRDRRGVGPAQTQQRRHAAASLWSASSVVAVRRSLPFALGAGHKLVRLVDHHALRKGQMSRLVYLLLSAVHRAHTCTHGSERLAFLSSLKGLPNVCRRFGCSGSASRRGWGADLRKS